MYLLIYVLIMYCMFNQLSKYKVKEVIVYMDPLINELLQLWNGITIYDVSRPIDPREFQLYAILVWTIHDAPWLTHICGML